MLSCTVFHTMTNAEKIIEFLRAHAGQWWCDPCINTVTEIRSVNQVSEITRELGEAKRYYERMKSTDCTGCGTRRKCVRAA
jgi:hypothetical protein